MEESIIARLLADTSVAALVSDRITPGRRGQAEDLPAITVHRISGGPNYTFDGEADQSEARVEINCWAKTYPDAKNTARAVTDSLSGFVGDESPITFRYIYLDAERDFEERGADAAEYLFRTSVDFIVMFDN